MRRVERIEATLLRTSIALLLLALIGCADLDFIVVPPGSVDGSINQDGRVHDGSAVDASADSATDATSEDGGTRDGDAAVGACEPPYLVVGLSQPYEVRLHDRYDGTHCKTLPVAGQLIRPQVTAFDPSADLLLVADEDSGTQGLSATTGTELFALEDPFFVASRPTHAFYTLLGEGTERVLALAWNTVPFEEQQSLESVETFDAKGLVQEINAVSDPAVPEGLVHSATSDPSNLRLWLLVRPKSRGVEVYSTTTGTVVGERINYEGLAEEDVETNGVIDAAMLTDSGARRIAVAVAEGVQSTSPRVYYGGQNGAALTPHAVCGACNGLERAFVDPREDGHVFVVCAASGAAELRTVFRQTLGQATCTTVLQSSDFGAQSILSVALSLP